MRSSRIIEIIKGTEAAVGTGQKPIASLFQTDTTAALLLFGVFITLSRAAGLLALSGRPTFDFEVK